MHTRPLRQTAPPVRPAAQEQGTRAPPPRPTTTSTTSAAPPPQPARTTSRRAAHAAVAAVLIAAACPPLPAAAGGLDKYVRKRKLDPLASYVPPVLDARAQLARLPDAFGEPKDARRLLRSGAFEGLRDNVRAIGEYAVAAAAAGGPTTTTAKDQAASRLATDFFTALESLDLVLYRAAREGGPTPPADADERLAAALDALDKLLATVPGDVLDAARRVVGVDGGAGSAGPGRGGGGPVPAAATLSEILPSGT